MFKTVNLKLKNYSKRIKSFLTKIKILFSENSDLYILENAILAQLNKMDEFAKNISSNIPMNFYLKEMRTLSIQLPRRMGNTTLAVNISKHFPHCYYIVHSAERAEQIRREFGIYGVYSYDQIIRNHALRGRMVDLVIIDECGFFNDLNEERLYENFQRIPNVKILKVGQL